MEIVYLTPETENTIIEKAIATLQSGGLVVYPTETTYGIGVDCEDEVAVQKLLAYKSKRDGKPLSVAVADQAGAEKYVHLNETARRVYRTFLPGPVTVISSSKGTVASGVTGTTTTVGIRIPNHPFVLSLLRRYGKGITATGANASYQKRPYTIQDIFDSLSEKQKTYIDLVIDAGQLPHNEPSTVIDTTLDDIVIKRFGDIAFKQKDTLTSHSAEQTKKVAGDLISAYRSKLTYEPVVIALTGEMGAGKTQFAKGIAQGLHMTETVTSPTYTLSNEYQFTNEGRAGLLTHIDTWRMETAQQLEELDIEKLIGQNGVVVIEWADRFADEIQKFGKSATLIWVHLVPTSDSGRTITILYPTTT